jgi:hypothetical protein
MNIRKRDKHRSQILAEKEIKNERLEKLSQDPNYKKPRKPIYDAQVCIKSDSKASDDDENAGKDDDEVEEGEISYVEETVNMRSKEAGVFFPLDVYDKGN